MTNRNVLSARLRNLLVVILAMAAVPAFGQEAYPARSVRIVSGFAAGGSLDLTARIVAEELSKRLGGTFVVEGKTGAGGSIAAAEVAKAKPDGYTLLLGFDGTLAIMPNVVSDLPFDSLKDFQPISKLVDVPLMVAANPSIPARNIAELIAFAKTKTGGLHYATSGLGTTPHLGGELLRARAGMDWTVVPYRGGAAATADVISGRTPLIYSSIAPVLPFLQSGQMVGIGIASPKRSSILPNVPTFREAGVSNSDVESWYALLAPAGTPRAIVDKLQLEISVILQQPEIIKRLSDLGLEASASKPEQVTEMLKSDLSRWKQITRDAKIQIK